MAIWKDTSPAKQPQSPSPKPSETKSAAADRPADTAPAPDRSKRREAMESVIAETLTIEGKIEGSGHIRLVGKFKGDVHVDGDLTIEPGAKVTGSVRADSVIVGGEVEGNIDDAKTVRLLESAVLNGDIKAGSVTVEAGSKMRGQADFGWSEKETQPSRMKLESGSAS